MSDKRRKQLRRFVDMRDDLLAQETALQAAIIDAHATVAATKRLLDMSEDEGFHRFRDYAASLDALGKVASPTVAEEASAVSARQAGHDPAAAQGVSGIITQLLRLPTAAEASNLGEAYAAILEQARLVHEGFTGNKGPSLAPVLLEQRGPSGSFGVVPPRKAWVPGTGPDPPGMPMPPGSATAPAAAVLRNATGPPVAHGGYAGPGAGGPAPTPAEAAGHEARPRSASRSAGKPRSSAAASAASSGAEERERSPRGESAIAAALASVVAEVEAAEAAEAAVAAAEAEAEAERPASTDDYMPDAGAGLPEDGAGPSSSARSPHSSRSAHSAAWGAPGSVDELRMVAQATAAILRQCVAASPGPDLDAARADADDAGAMLAAALAAQRARSGGHNARPMPHPL